MLQSIEEAAKTYPTLTEAEIRRQAEMLWGGELPAGATVQVDIETGYVHIGIPMQIVKRPTVVLRCAACGRYLGDNNEPIREGTHAGARPTDMTTFCKVTERQEPVILGPATMNLTDKVGGAPLEPWMIDRMKEKCLGPKEPESTETARTLPEQQRTNGSAISNYPHEAKERSTR